MFVRIDTIPAPTDDTVDTLRAGAGDSFVALLAPMDQRAVVLVTRGHDVADSARPDGASDTRTFQDSELFSSGGDLDPAFAQLTWLDGPRSAEQVEALHRAGRERIWPAVRELAGGVEALNATSADGAIVVISFTASLQAVDDAQRAIMSTTLLPWEDPALLSGPERIQIARVLAHSLPTPLHHQNQE